MIVELINSGKEGRAVLDCYMGRLYHNTSERFLHNALPDLSRCLKCDDSAAVVVEYESDREHSDDGELG